MSLFKKRLRWPLKSPAESIPVFVFGKQRSGTTMLMDVFHARSDTEVFDERQDGVAFQDYRLRGFDVAEELVVKSRARFVCFKPLADSHLIREFAARFPTASLIWIYRHYMDVALSSTKKIRDGARAITLVCTGQPGGGWFAEGVSPQTKELLTAVYRPSLSSVELSCLVWWARNRLVVERGVHSLPNAVIVKYEDIMMHPEHVLGEMFHSIGMPDNARAVRRVVELRERKKVYPALDADVKRLCDNLLTTLDLCRSCSATPLTE